MLVTCCPRDRRRTLSQARTEDWTKFVGKECDQEQLWGLDDRRMENSAESTTTKLQSKTRDTFNAKYDLTLTSSRSKHRDNVSVKSTRHCNIDFAKHSLPSSAASAGAGDGYVAPGSKRTRFTSVDELLQSSSDDAQLPAQTSVFRRPAEISCGPSTRLLSARQRSVTSQPLSDCLGLVKPRTENEAARAFRDRFQFRLDPHPPSCRTGGELGRLSRGGASVDGQNAPLDLQRCLLLSRFYAAAAAASQQRIMAVAAAHVMWSSLYRGAVGKQTESSPGMMSADLAPLQSAEYFHASVNKSPSSTGNLVNWLLDPSMTTMTLASTDPCRHQRQHEEQNRGDNYSVLERLRRRRSCLSCRGPMSEARWNGGPASTVETGTFCCSSTCVACSSSPSVEGPRGPSLITVLDTLPASQLTPPRPSSVHQSNFSCRLCPKRYATSGAMKMHARTHTLPCRCGVCGKAFSRPWLLQGHLRTHTGEKPFQCPDCQRAFADRSNLRAHLQTHAVVKKYRCRHCAKTFSRLSLLLKHEEGPACPGR